MEDSIKDFLNPKSALTIGGSSAMVLAFTTTLCNAFCWPAAIVAISLSALFAAIQVGAMEDVKKWWLRPLYGIICTLVIFNAARGGNASLAEGERVLSSPMTMAGKVSESMDGGYDEPSMASPEEYEIIDEADIPMHINVPSQELESNPIGFLRITDLFVSTAYAGGTNSATSFKFSTITTNGWPVYTNSLGVAYTNKAVKVRLKKIKPITMIVSTNLPPKPEPTKWQKFRPARDEENSKVIQQSPGQGVFKPWGWK